MIERLRARLAPDVRFHSPVADYAGADDVGHLLDAIAAVLGDVSVVREVPDGDAATITFITAVVDGHRLDGVLDERRDEAGRVAELTLLLRPFAGLRAAIGLMAARLSADPLPSDRG